MASPVVVPLVGRRWRHASASPPRAASPGSGRGTVFGIRYNTSGRAWRTVPFTVQFARREGQMDPQNQAGSGLSQATLGGGCFCCLEAVSEQVGGGKKVVSGNTGGRWS